MGRNRLTALYEYQGWHKSPQRLIALGKDCPKTENAVQGLTEVIQCQLCRGTLNSDGVTVIHFFMEKRPPWGTMHQMGRFTAMHAISTIMPGLARWRKGGHSPEADFLSHEGTGDLKVTLRTSAQSEAGFKY